MRINLKVSILVVTSAILFTACGGESAKDATEKFYKIEKHNDEVKENLVNFKVGELKS